MARQPDQWPEGLSDLLAIKRLRAILLAAAQGNQDLTNDRQYKSLRRVLLHRADLRERAPRIVEGATNLAQAAAALRSIADRTERIDHVRAQFGPLIQSLNPEAEPIDSDDWTGRKLAAQQAAVVKRLALPALQVIEALIVENEARNHNGGPVEPIEAEALAQLRELKSALEALIDLAEREQPIAEQLGRLERLRKRASAAMMESLLQDAEAAPATVTTFGYGAIIAVLTGWLTGAGLDPTALAAGGAVTTVHTAYRVVRASAATKSDSDPGGR